MFRITRRLVMWSDYGNGDISVPELMSSMYRSRKGTLRFMVAPLSRACNGFVQKLCEWDVWI